MRPLKRLIQWITWTPTRLLLTIAAVLALLGAVIATAITLTHTPSTTAPATPSAPTRPAGPATPRHDTPPALSTPLPPTPSPTGPPVAATSPSFTPLQLMPEEVLQPVRTYLTAHQNQWGAHRDQPADWLTDARPALTATYYDRLAAEFDAVKGGSLGADWHDYHNNGWKTQISNISCFAHPIGKPPGSPDNPIQCTYKRTLTDLNDTPLPGQRPPNPTTWTPTASALLAVVYDNGWWYISDDVTDKAG